MGKKYFYYEKEPTNYTKYATIFILVIFCLSVATFSLVEVSNFYSDQPTVLRILKHNFESSEVDESLNSPSNIITEDELNSQRLGRAASENKTNSGQTSNSYYEEQTPVVVYSKTDIDPTIAQRQMADVPPRQDTDEEDPYSRIFDDAYGAGDHSDYFVQEDERLQQPQTYYGQQRLPQPPPYYRQQENYGNPETPPQYYMNSREHFSNPDDQQYDSEEARSAQFKDYYRQYPYATLPPMLTAGSSSNKRLMSAINPENRNLQPASKPKAQQQNRVPYDTYMDDYDSLPPHYYSPTSRPQLSYANRTPLQQMLQYRNPSSTLPADENQETNQQMDLLTMFKSLKTMWDLYQSFTSSWNTIAERRNHEEEIAKQKYKQMHQNRINSKKPPTFNSKRNITATTKYRRKQTTTTSTTVMPTTLTEYTSHEEEDEDSVEQQAMAKIEPRKGAKTTKAKAKNADVPRDKRQVANDINDSTEVGEGRYIKGDPLKGYYDFVITEGSYKFWAAFQVGTAILIIYSTFAAIYYSKVNPLVSDYDYTDYLGGARSLSGGDLDFVDDFEGGVEKAQQKSWLEWLPRTSHSLKFILDAIDKLPIDHAVVEDDNEPHEAENSNEHAEETVYTEAIESSAEIEKSNETRHTKEDYSKETESLDNGKYDNNAM